MTPAPDNTGQAATASTQVHGSSTDRIRASYIELAGSVPPSIEQRLTLADRTGRTEAVEAIEALRDVLIMKNPLGRKTGQLVHFGQLVALGEAVPARLHARAALQAGATIEELAGVAELALITSGMPAYSLGVEILAELGSTHQGGVP
ncbi:MAG: carboxymuconolactone decarboxylase family protein [Acidimicrobiales bacterium]